MSDASRRRADRVPASILAQLHAPRGRVTAHVVDLSRTGVRLRAEARDLGMPVPEEEAQALEAVRGVLRATFPLALNHERLGSLLQRHVDLVRVTLPTTREGTLELSCSFREALDETEAQLLEAHLPLARPDVAPPEPTELPEGGVPSGALREMLARGPVQPPGPEPAPAGQRPRQQYHALVSASRDGVLQTFRCHTDLVTGIGIRIAIPRGGYGDEPGLAARAFTQRYGAHLDLRISDEDVDVWGGRVRVSGVELPAQRPEVMLVTLAFDRALALHELRNLGLVQRVA